MDSYTIYAIAFIILLVLLGMGLPIAFVLGSVAILGIIFFTDPTALFQIAQLAFRYGSSFLFTMVPLFVFMAEAISIAGLGKDIYAAAHKWLRRLPGGLAVSSIATCAGFAAVCGSSPATAATVSVVAIPEMLDRGYNRKLAVGSLLSGGTLGILIPPSLCMIIYGVMAMTSVGELFIAGIIPGIILAIMLSLSVIIRVMLKPSMAPTLDKVGWRERFVSLKGIWPVIVLAVAVLGSIYTGIATPTESAAIGAAGALLFAIGSRNMSWTSLQKALIRTTTTTSMVIFLFIGGTSLSFFLSMMGLPHQVSNFLLSFSFSPWIVLILINIMYLILGCLMDPTSVMVITLPILVPVIAGMGFNLVWFGIIVTINIEIGMITPPVGMNLFILKAVLPKLKMEEIVLGALPFVAILIAALAVMMIFPELSLWLPSTMSSK